MSQRPSLAELGLSTGKKARLRRILFQHGAGNGTALFLPYDQGLEHGPRDFFANPLASDPKYVIRLALEGGFNGIAIQIGLAQKFYWEYAGEVPLVLKLNGKTDIPAAIDPLSPLNATVADAVGWARTPSATPCMLARRRKNATLPSTCRSGKTRSGSACR